MKFVFQMTLHAFQNITLRLSFKRWRKSCLYKEFRALSAPIPDISYILYPTTARVSIISARVRNMAAGLDWLSSAETDRHAPLNLHSRLAKKIKENLIMGKNKEIDVMDNPLYHDTWKLLKKYRVQESSYSGYSTQTQAD